MELFVKKSDPAATIVRIVLFFAILYLIYLVREIFTPIIIALLLFYILNPLVSVLSDKKGKGLGMNRALSIFITLLVFVAIIGIFIRFVVPPITGEFKNFVGNLPGYLLTLEDYANQITAQYETYKIPQEITTLISQGIQNILIVIIEFIQSFFSGVFALSGHFIQLIIIPLLVYYMLKDKEKLYEGFIGFIPRKQRDKTVKIFSEANKVLKNYIKSIVTLMLIVGFAIMIGLMFLGVKYAIILGLIAGLTEAIPFLGPWLGGAIGVTVALFTSPVLAVKVLILYVVIQLFENAVLVPKIIGAHLDLHPVVVILAMLVLGKLIGAWGLFLAGPIVAILLVVYSELKPRF